MIIRRISVGVEVKQLLLKIWKLEIEYFAVR